MNTISTPAATPVPRLPIPHRAVLLRFARSIADVARRWGAFLLRLVAAPGSMLDQFIEVEVLERGFWCAPCRDVHPKGTDCQRPRVVGFCVSCDRRRVTTARGNCPLGHTDVINRHFYVPRKLKLTARPTSSDAFSDRSPERRGAAAG